MTITTYDESEGLSSVSRALLLSSIREGDLTGEAGLARKILASLKPAKEVVFEFTNDPGQLHQYYRLRDQLFISVWGLNHIPGAEEALDKASHIMVARQGLLCVGGGRLTISSAAHRQLMPMESEDFALGNVLPELDLAQSTYAELSRFAIMQDFRDDKIFPELLSRFIRRAIAEGVDYLFHAAPLSATKSYRQSVQALGFDCHTRRDLEIPDREEFDGVKMALSVMDLTSAKTRRAGEAEIAERLPELLAG